MEDCPTQRDPLAHAAWKVRGARLTLVGEVNQGQSFCNTLALQAPPEPISPCEKLEVFPDLELGLKREVLRHVAAGGLPPFRVGPHTSPRQEGVPSIGLEQPA